MRRSTPRIMLRRGEGRVALLRRKYAQGQHPGGRVHAVEASLKFQAEVPATAGADDTMPAFPERTSVNRDGTGLMRIALADVKGFNFWVVGEGS